MHIGLRIIVNNIRTCFYIPHDLSNLWYISLYGESFTSCRILPVEALFLFYFMILPILLWIGGSNQNVFLSRWHFQPSPQPKPMMIDAQHNYVIIHTSISLLIFTELTYIVLFIVLEKRITLSLRYETVLRRNWEH